MRRKASALLLALATLATAVAAQPPTGTPRSAKAELRMPRGPIKITAERADLERREMALYRGNVKLVSAELELGGDRLELRQPAKGQFHAVLTGKPARLNHQGAADVPPLSASAGKIVYDTRTSLVELSGGASLTRGSDTVSSDSISYNLAARRISASGAGGSQVQIVIEPPAGNGQEKPAPVPQNTPPPVPSPSQ
jgi:lipopolysaccharide transport protein LptA